MDIPSVISIHSSLTTNPIAPVTPRQDVQQLHILSRLRLALIINLLFTFILIPFSRQPQTIDTMTRPITPPKHTGPRTRIFVVGLGMVGIAFIEKILNNDVEGRYKIITCGEEKHLAYNRVGLTHYMEVRDINKMYLNSPEWYQQQDPERL
jgi:hypothetical protein